MTESTPQLPSPISSSDLRGRLAAALVESGRIPVEMLNNLWQRTSWAEEPFEYLLLRENILTEEELLEQLSSISGIPRFESRTVSTDEAMAALIPPQAAVRYRIAPIAIDGLQLVLATDHLRDADEEARMRVVLGHPIRWMLCTAREVSELITHFYGVGVGTCINLLENAQRGARREGDEDIAGMPDFIDEILRDAIRSNATDIHVEPDAATLRIRYRIDGVLYPARLPRGIEQLQRPLISSLKVMAQLNIAERRLPQDGRLEKILDGHPFDIRVSVLPTRFGESVELRLLNRAATFLRMDELGIPRLARSQIEDLIARPNGLILFTGPTGSGKTTSLYAAMARLNDSERKIITLEDPVEYQIPGITQMQVQPQIGFSFANGLRSILRHDPDVILVGEVRDDETADIAVSAALTGHTVFSTLHTNDSASAATRLLDMGIEPYLVASSLQGVIAQRLVRRICPRCREERPIDEPYHIEIHQCLPEHKEPLRAWHGRGCPDCRFTGYRGRRAIYEILDIDDAVRTLIIERAPGTAIMHHAVQQGTHTLRTAGWDLVLQGETSIQDLLRVTSRPPAKPQKKRVNGAWLAVGSPSG